MEPIDAVLTWVDGDDPNHLARRKRFDPGFGAEGTEDTRFANCEEIRFSLLGLLRFAPWLRMIHIVTDRQIPAVVEELFDKTPELAQRIKIVDHSSIFAPQVNLLPVFSSLSIESVIHRIPDLAERYLYLNDDFFFVRPTTPDDFFTSAGPILRGAWMTRAIGFIAVVRKCIAMLRGRENGWQPVSFKLQQLRGAKLAGPGLRFFVSGHFPHPLRRSTLQRFEVAQPKTVVANMAHRFRHGAQYNTVSLANHLELAMGCARLAESENTVYFRADTDKPSRMREKISKVEARSDVLFICINSLDQASAEVQNEILAFLRRQIL